MTTDQKSEMEPEDNGALLSLVMASKQGEKKALNILLRQCQNYLLLIANQELPDALQTKLGASDIVQETLLLAHQNFHQFQGDSKEELNGWLRQILRNEIKTVHRHYVGSKKRDADREQRLNDSRIENPLVADSLNTPGAAALQSEEELLVATAISKLPENYQTAVRLRNWEQLTFDEIGERLEMSGEAARKLWTRAIVKLESELASMGINWDK